MRLWRGALRSGVGLSRLAPGLFAVSLALTGCTAFLSPGASSVEEARLYAPGEPWYDQFFREVHEAQVASEGFPQDEAKIRVALAHALGAPGHTPELLAEAAATRAERLAHAGVRMRLDVDGDPWRGPAFAHVSVQGKPEESEAVAIKAIESAAQDALSLLERLAGEADRLERLGPMGEGLVENVGTTFRKSSLSKRAEVRKNVNAARALVPILQFRVRDTASELRRLLRELARSVRTMEGAVCTPVADAPLVPATDPAKRVRARPAPAGRPGAGLRPAVPRSTAPRPTGPRPGGPAPAPADPKAPPPAPPTNAPDFEP
jgi:hypothetical protein